MSKNPATAVEGSAAGPASAGVGVSRPSVIVCRQALSAAAMKEHLSIRHQVFVLEQGLFVGTDRDDHDLNETTIRLVGYCDEVAAGSVRLFELDPATGLWQGDRLAVLPHFRASGLGGPLVRCAVAAAGALGGSQMMAHIQVANIRFFTRLGWTPVGETETYVGLPHQQMRISLPSRERGAALVKACAEGTLRHP